MATKLFYEAADRNKKPILDVLRRVIEKDFTNASRVSVLEIGAGTGQHAIHFCLELPKIICQPTDIDDKCLKSINAYIKESRVSNILKPIKFDVTQPIDALKFLNKNYDIIISINLNHIASWNCTEGLFNVAGDLLSCGGILLTYGPYAANGVITPESNVNFNKYLQERDPNWGIRDIVDLTELGMKQNIKLETIFDMPANNKTLLWRKCYEK